MENNEIRQAPPKEPILVQAKTGTRQSLDDQQHYIHLPIQELLAFKYKSWAAEKTWNIPDP